MKKTAAFAAIVAVVALGVSATPASAACQAKPKPGQYGGTGCFSVVQGGRA